MAFEDHLTKACEHGEAGFHFEEGGCIAMALEIHAALKAEGRSASYAVDRKSCHVYVQCDGFLIDHQGANLLVPVDLFSEAELMALSAEWGVNFRLAEDRAWARDIVDNAIEMAVAIESSGARHQAY